MFDFIDIKTLITVFHLIGLAIGAGGAYTSDLIFFSSIRDKVITDTELRFLKLGSISIWVGLSILIASGIGLFALSPDNYLSSSKFISKMIIVAIILVNGIVFYALHIPQIAKHTDEYMPDSDEFSKKSALLFASGAISIVSWTYAIVLGAVRSIPYSIGTIMAIYLICVLLAVISSIILRKKFFSN